MQVFRIRGTQARWTIICIPSALVKTSWQVNVEAHLSALPMTKALRSVSSLFILAVANGGDTAASHPLDPLSATEIHLVAELCRAFAEQNGHGPIRFNTIGLKVLLRLLIFLRIHTYIEIQIVLALGEVRIPLSAISASHDSLAAHTLYKMLF